MENLQYTLFEIERKLWTNDPFFYENALTKDVILLFSDIGQVDRDFAVQAIHKENEENRKWAEVNFSEEQYRLLSPEAALLTYRVSARWNFKAGFLHIIASSIYIKDDTGWKLCFHQQSDLEIK